MTSVSRRRPIPLTTPRIDGAGGSAHRPRGGGATGVQPCSTHRLRLLPLPSLWGSHRECSRTRVTRTATSGTTRKSSQVNFASVGAVQASTTDSATMLSTMTTRTRAVRSSRTERRHIPDEVVLGGVEEDPLRAEADGHEVESEQGDGHWVGAVATDEVRREWHERQGEEKAEVTPGQSFAVAAHAAEDAVVHHPELGNDEERDQIARQLRPVGAESVPQLPSGVGILREQGGGWHLQLQDQQGQGDGDDAVGQRQEAVDAWHVLVVRLGRHPHELGR